MTVNPSLACPPRRLRALPSRWTPTAVAAGLALVHLALLAPAALHAQEAHARFGPPGGAQIRLRSTTDIAILAPVLEAFVARNPDLAVAYEQWGSNDLYALALAECRARRVVPETWRLDHG